MTFQDLNEIEGLQFMPILQNKVPIHENWQNAKKKYDMSRAVASGLVCGLLSGGLEAIDFDLKYDLSGTLMNDYVEAVNSIKPDLMAKMVVQKTQNNGYHLIYRCAKVSGNEKLANRDSTIQEKQYTYDSTLQNEIAKLSATCPDQNKVFNDASIKAKKAMEGDKVRVLIETRGEKGQIACYPTPGYQMIQGDFRSIQEISPEERNILFDVAFSFNTYFKSEPDRPAVMQQRKTTPGLTPSEDYNERGDVVGLLLNHGWTFVQKRGDKVILRRPGDTSAKSSGNWDEDKKWFSVFSTSTEFESQKPYKPYAVFAILECGGDYSKVTKKLADLGFGDRLERYPDTRPAVPSIIDMNNEDDLSFLADDADYDEYIHKWRTGTFEMGATTGIAELDKYFLFKKSNLVIVNGLDNVGKSTIIWYLMFLAALYHGWKSIIFSSENKVGAVKKKIMEFYWCKSIRDMTEQEYDVANSFFKTHFKLIKNGSKLYNYQDWLNMVSKVIKKYPSEMVLADPYNSFKVESKQSYEYHYEAASNIKLFGDKNNLSIYLNAHVGTTAARRKDENGYTLAPGKEDTEMGVMFANKADDFVTVHRLTDHDTEFSFSELHVRKIKETETGGKPTPRGKPVYLKSLPGLVGFVQVDSKSAGASGINPVTSYHNFHANVAKFDITKQTIQPKDFPQMVLSNSEDEDEAPF